MKRRMDMLTTQPKTHITGVHTVGIPVTDQDLALTFYVETLGFEKRIEAAYGTGERWIEVAPPGATTTIALIAAAAGDPPVIDTRAALLRAVRFMTDDAAAAHADLLARGVDVDAEVTRWGGPMPPMFTFRDPDANLLLIVERASA